VRPVTSLPDRNERPSSLLPLAATHELKCWPPYFGVIIDGTKTFEVRKNDRGFQKGDVLLLREWDPHSNFGSGGYTGRDFTMLVTYVLQGGMFGIETGYCVLGLSDDD
jgi:hypothetical protein